MLAKSTPALIVLVAPVLLLLTATLLITKGQ